MPRKTLVKNGYLPRLVDEQIERYLEVFGAVEVAGTKWCGKTWTALAHAQSVSYVDEELDMARADPKLMLIGDPPRYRRMAACACDLECSSSCHR